MNRPVLCAISNTSGLAGIAHWINTYFHIPADQWFEKSDTLITTMKEWVDEQYAEGRVTVMTDDELVAQIAKICKEKNISIPGQDLD